MDDKTINLWRQIEDCRRRGRGQAGNRFEPATLQERRGRLAREAYNQQSKRP